MKNWRLWVGILVSLLCLYLAAKGVDFRSLLQALSHVHHILLLPAVGLVAFGFLARAFRWRLLFQPLPGLKIGRLFNILSIGYLFNNLFPFRLGDVLRSYLCAELESLSVARTLSTVIVERIADTLTILFLLLWVIPFIALPSALLRPALGISVVAVVAVLFLVFLASRKEQGLTLVDSLTKRFGFLNHDWIKRSAVSAIDGLAALGSWHSVLGVWGWSMAIWLSAALQFYVIMWAASLHLPPVTALVVLCLTSLGMTIPSSPGYIGVFEYLTVVSLSLFGVNREAALGYALVAHALSYLSVAALGLGAAWVEGYSVMRLRNVAGQVGVKQNST